MHGMNDDSLDIIKDQLAALLEASVAPGQVESMLNVADLIENLIEAKLVKSGVLVILGDD